MSFLTDILDFSGDFERKLIAGGQTEGFVNVREKPGSNLSAERRRGFGGTDYAHVIRQREDEKERIKMVIMFRNLNIFVVSKNMLNIVSSFF